MIPKNRHNFTTNNGIEILNTEYTQENQSDLSTILIQQKNT